MKTTEIVGFKREQLGTKYSKQLRADGNVPCILYGGEEIFHFHSPAYLFRELLYTPDAYIVKLNVEGVEKNCVLREAQYHPVSDNILHVDLLEIFDDKPVVIDIPVKLMGVSAGVLAGGRMVIKNKKLKVKAFAKDLPDYIEVDITNLEVGKSTKVKDLPAGKYEVLNNPNVTIASVAITRALRQAAADK